MCPDGVLTRMCGAVVQVRSIQRAWKRRRRALQSAARETKTGSQHHAAVDASEETKGQLATIRGRLPLDLGRDSSSLVEREPLAPPEPWTPAAERTKRQRRILNTALSQLGVPCGAGDTDYKLWTTAIALCNM